MEGCFSPVAGRGKLAPRDEGVAAPVLTGVPWSEGFANGFDSGAKTDCDGFGGMSVEFCLKKGLPAVSLDARPENPLEGWKLLPETWGKGVKLVDFGSSVIWAKGFGGFASTTGAGV